jgi:PhzF family phenazine biosynthesis protein
MKSYQLKHIDAFADRHCVGNPAGVVIDARGLTDAKMRAVAREMNLSETAFILPPTVRNADLQIRWFTPTHEVALCGHATIASFHALAEEGALGMKNSGTYRFRLQTKSGVLGIVVEKKYSCTLVEFQIPLPHFTEMRKVPNELFRVLGVTRRDVESRLPTVRHSFLFLPLRRLSVLKNMRPEMSALASLSRRLRVLGVTAFTLATIERSSAVHSRCFVPVVGIDEDPVTGSSNGPLGYYLYRYALPAGYPIPSFILPDGRIEFIGEQGDIIGRKGRVKIRLKLAGDGVQYLAIAGEAVTVLEGTVRL